MATSELQIVLTAVNKTTAELTKVQNSIANLSKTAKAGGTQMQNSFGGIIQSAKRLATTLGVAFGAYQVVNFFKSSIAEAKKAQVEWDLVGKRIEAVGMSWSATEPLVRSFSTAMQELGRNDEEVAIGISTLVAKTGNLAQSMTLTKAASDLAASGFGTMEENVDAFAKILVGRGAFALRQFNIKLPATATIAEQLDAVLAKITRRTEDWAKTTEGQTAIAKEKWTEFKEDFGTKILPLVTAALQYLMKIVDEVRKKWEELTAWYEVHSGFIKGTVIPAIVALVETLLTLFVISKIIALFQGLQAAYVAIIGANTAVAGSFTLVAGAATTLMGVLLPLTAAVAAYYLISGQIKGLVKDQQAAADSEVAAIDMKLDAIKKARTLEAEAEATGNAKIVELAKVKAELLRAIARGETGDKLKELRAQRTAIEAEIAKSPELTGLVANLPSSKAATTKQLSDLDKLIAEAKGKIENVKIQLPDLSSDKAEKQIEKLESALDDLTSTYVDTKNKIADSLAGLVSDHEDKMSDIKKSILDVENQMRDLGNEYTKQGADIHKEAAQRIAEVYSGLADKRTELEQLQNEESSYENIIRYRQLQAEIKKEEDFLKSNNEYLKSLQGDITAAVEFNAKSQAEQIIILAQQRSAANEAEYQDKLSKLQLEKAAYLQQQATEEAAYKAKLIAIQEMDIAATLLYQTELDNRAKVTDAYINVEKEKWKDLQRVIEGAIAAQQRAVTMTTAGTPKLSVTPVKKASGGIITAPTRVLVGEAGPEAIVPLTGQQYAVAPNYVVNVNGGYYLSESAAEKMGDLILKRLKENLRI